MSCGSCGTKYKANRSNIITDPVKGSSKGVIKKASLAATQLVPSSSEEGEEVPPPVVNPVDGNSGPSTESE